MSSLHRSTAALGAAALAVLAISRALRRVEVAGESMAPALLPGDRLLVLRPLPLRRGQVVAVRDPREPSRLLVKRLAAVPGEAVTAGGEVLRARSGYVVLGDNPEASTDSRSFGAVPRSLLLGRCVWRYAPEERRGAL